MNYILNFEQNIIVAFVVKSSNLYGTIANEETVRGFQLTSISNKKVTV